MAETTKPDVAIARALDATGLLGSADLADVADFCKELEAQGFVVSRPAPSEASGDVVEANKPKRPTGDDCIDHPHAALCYEAGRHEWNNDKTFCRYCEEPYVAALPPTPVPKAVRGEGRMEIASARKKQAILVLDGASVGSANYEIALQIRDLWNAQPTESQTDAGEAK